MILFVIDIDWTVCCYILPYNFSLGGRGVIAWIGRGYRRENFRSGFMQIGFCQNVWAELRNIMLSIVQFSKGEKRKQLWFLAKNNSISKCQWLFDGHCLSLPHIFYTMVHNFAQFLIHCSSIRCNVLFYHTWVYSCPYLALSSALSNWKPTEFRTQARMFALNFIFAFVLKIKCIH